MKISSQVSGSFTLDMNRVSRTIALEDDKRTLYQLLGRLHLPDDVDGTEVGPLQLLIDNLKRVGTPPPF